MSTQEKIKKVDEKIIQLELEIEERKEKIKKLKAQKKALEAKLDKEFADKLVKTIIAKGISTDEERESILRQISSLTAKTSATSSEESNAEIKENSESQSEPQFLQNDENLNQKTYS